MPEISTDYEVDEAHNALIKIDEIRPKEVFGEGKTDVIIDYIRGQVADVPADVSTAKGRSQIKSMAYRITRSKTLLDEVGKVYAAKLKATVANIDKNRRIVRDSLDALRDELRKPLTDYEAAIEAEAGRISTAINTLISAGQKTAGTVADLTAELARVKAVTIDEATFGEKQGEAAIAKDIAVSNLERALIGATRREADQAELARLRKLQLEQDERNRVQRIQEAARLKAEQDAAARIAEAERAAEAAKAAAARAAKEAEDRIEAEREDRERKAREALKAEEARAADHEHRRNANNSAVEAIVEWTDLTTDQARDVVTLIAAGRVPFISIRY